MQYKSGAIIIEGHVQGLSNTRALGKAGVPVIVVDKSKCIARYSKYCRGFFSCPDYQDDALADFLLELAKKQKLEGWVLIPSNDHAVQTISRNKKKLEKVYKFLIPDLDALDNIINKSKLLEAAIKVEVPVPETTYFTSANDPYTGKLPVLTKGKAGLSFYKTFGKKAFFAHDENELRSQLATIEKIMPLDKTFTQEVIPFEVENDKTLSCSCFSVEGKVKAFWMGVKVREHPPKFGTATFSESIYVEECIESSKKLLAHLKYTGVSEVEFLRDSRDNKYKLIEINPRTWLWVGHAISDGINFPLMIYNHVNKIENNFPKTYRSGTKWYNIITDTIFAGVGILKKEHSISDYIKSMKGKKAHAVFQKGDPKPGIMFIVLLPYFLLNR